VPAAPSQSPAAPAKSSRWPLFLIIVLLMALAGVGAGWYLSIQHKTEADTIPAVQPILPAPALYYALEPAFIVNLDSAGFEGPRYLQLEVQLMTRDPRVHAALAEHAPALRARLLLLFDEISINEIATREDKQNLQHKALDEVRHLIQAETGSDAIEALLFTSFVTQ